MTYRNIRVKKKGGGFRTQRAMVLASGRLRFVKNTGHTAKARKPVARKRRSKSSAVVHRRRVHRAPARRRRRSGGGGGASLPVLPIAVSAATLAYLTGASGPKQVRDLANRIPGAKTFGPLAVLGGGCLVVDRFVKRNKWLRLAGVVGIAAAAMKVGEQGANFKWVGDDDIGMLDDVGYDDMGDVGDDEMGDIGDIGDVGDDE